MNLEFCLIIFFICAVLWLGIKSLYRKFLKKSAQKTSRARLIVDWFYIFFMFFTLGWILFRISFFYIIEYSFVSQQLQLIEQQLLEYQKEHNALPDDMMNASFNSKLDKKNMLYVKPMSFDSEKLPCITLYHNGIVYTKNIGERVMVTYE